MPAAERSLKDRLRADDADIAALRMLGELAVRLGRLPDAQNLLERALWLAPGFAAARLNYATVLHRRNLLPEALAQLELLLTDEPLDPASLTLKAAVLARIGEYPAAIAIYQTILARYPAQSTLWMSMGHALKTVGRTRDGVDAYRQAIKLDEDLGEAWWSLANLKTVRFETADIDRMLAAIARSRSTADVYHLHFALGKAFEDRAEYAASFHHYETGAGLRRATIAYDPGRTTRHLAQARQKLTPAILSARADQGWPDPAPIFIVGLPRSGSTLIEQILASHSQVEGTMELPDLGMIARDLADPGTATSDNADGGAVTYLDMLLARDPAELAELGQRYIQRSRIQRKTALPFFIDKMPNNFVHIGLIKLILPNAKVIDTRRHPIATCFSAFKQHFSRGQAFSYTLDELASYYRDYIALMDHHDTIMPGFVHRVIYENLIDDPEREIRRLLCYCHLAFEPACLDFHNTDRPVRTASSEQVRQPLNNAAVDHWQHYDAWLEPLKRGLKDTVKRHLHDCRQSP